MRGHHSSTTKTFANHATKKTNITSVRNATSQLPSLPILLLCSVICTFNVTFQRCHMFTYAPSAFSRRLGPPSSRVRAARTAGWSGQVRFPGGAFRCHTHKVPPTHHERQATSSAGRTDVTPPRRTDTQSA